MRMKSIYIFCIALLVKITSTQGTVEPSAEEGLRKLLLDKYNKDVLPPHNGTNPVGVEFGMALISIHDIDVSQETINVNVWLKLRWTDSRLRWKEEQHGNISILRMDVNQFWTPDVTLYNSAVSPHSVRTEMAIFYPSGHVVWIRDTQLLALCQFHLTYYPYDTHNCSLKFSSWSHDELHLDFKILANRTKLDQMDYWESNNWEVVSTYIHKKSNCCDTPYPYVVASMALRRHSSMQQAAILFPIAAVILLAFTAFLCSPFHSIRLFINAFNILLNMLTLLYLQQELPVAGRSSPAIVLICESMILLMSLAIVWSVVTMSFIGRYKSSRPPQVVQWLISSWLTKVLLVSRGHHMEECSKKILDISQTNDIEIMSMMTEDKSVVTNGWLMFFSLLDRLAFLTFTIIVFALLIALIS